MKKISLIICAIFLSLPSCHVGNNKIPVSTPSFDSAIAKAEHIYDAGGKMAALDYIVDVHNKSTRLTIQDEMTFYSYCNTIYMKDLNNYDKSIEIADTMLWLLEHSGHMKDLPIRHVQIYNIKADALMAKGLYNEAYDCYFKAKVLAKDNADSCSFSAYSHSLGMVLYRQQKYLEAARYFKQAFDESHLCVDDFTYFYLRQELLDNVGLSYGRAHKYDSATIYYKMALDYIHKNFNRFPNKNANVYEAAEAVVLGNLADVYIAEGNYDTAQLLLRKSIAVNLQKGYTNADAEVDQIKLADLYLITKNDTALKRLLQNVEAELDTIPNKFVELNWNRLMWRYYEHKKDPVNGYRYVVAYVTQNDSFLAKNKTLMTTDIDGRVKNLERQYQISLLEKSKQRDELFRIIAIITVLMAIAIVSLLLRSASRASRNVKLLTQLNDEVNEHKKKLEDAFAELEMRDMDKSRILRSVAHDVMSPIAAIASLVDILINESASYSEEHVEMLNMIRDACNNSLNLSRDILEAAVAIAPGNLSKEWVNINKLVAGCVELLNVRAHDKKQHINIVFDDKNINAYINKEKVWRVVNNLITNAIKFSYEGSIIEVELDKADELITISVKDKGIGIPQKNKDNIFDMFTESKVYGTSGEKPHGIGLSISLQIARSHGGDVTFESEEGTGTTFKFTFPVQTP